MAMGLNFFFGPISSALCDRLDAVLCPLLVRYYPSQGCS